MFERLKLMDIARPASNVRIRSVNIYRLVYLFRLVSLLPAVSVFFEAMPIGDAACENIERGVEPVLVFKEWGMPHSRLNG
jgi:hypothetical protein